MEDIKTRRGGFDQLGNIYPKATEVIVGQENTYGINCYRLLPENEVLKSITIYLHGDVFAVGSIRSHGSMISHFSQNLHSRMLFIDYALAPENPFPSALNNVIQVYKEIIKTYPECEISFIGDSENKDLIEESKSSSNH